VMWQKLDNWLFNKIMEWKIKSFIKLMGG
jgi:hypothetical protein